MPSLIVHAGAGEVPTADRAAYSAGVERAARAGWDVLRGGGSALEAARLAVRTIEEHGPSAVAGAVACDGAGRIAADASAAVPRTCLRSDDGVCGVACASGDEDGLSFDLADRAFELARECAAQDACWLAMRELELRSGARGGVVMLTPDGGIGYAFNTTSMPLAWIDDDVRDPVIGGIAT